MVITDVQLPVCDYCGHNPCIEKLPGQPADGAETHMFFVMCKSDPCSIRKDTGLRHVGRVLSNGLASQHKAEEEWKATARTQAYRDRLAKVQL